jgi:glycosyltransferase involved in cell wall biosynthesis
VVAYTHLPSDARIIKETVVEAESGFFVSVFVPAYSPELVSEFQGKENLRVIEVDVPSQRGKTSFIGQFRFILALRKVLSTHAIPEVVHVHNMPDYLVLALPALWKGASRIVLDVHDMMSVLAKVRFVKPVGLFLSLLLSVVEKIIWRRVDAIVTVNDPYKLNISRRVKRDLPILVLPNLPDLDLIPREKKRNNGIFTVCFHGTVSRRTGVSCLVMAFRAIAPLRENVNLLIIGDGNSSEEVQQMIDEIGLPKRIEFRNEFYPTSEVYDMLKEIDIGVVPNIRSAYTDDVVPVKFLEYCAIGVPIVATGSPLLKEFTGNSGAFFIDEPTVAELSHALLKIIDETEIYQSLSTQSLEVARNNSWQSQKVELATFMWKLVEEA